MKICVYRNMSWYQNAYVPMLAGMCVYRRKCVWICVCENMCLDDDTCVPMSVSYVCVYERMREDSCICVNEIICLYANAYAPRYVCGYV